MSIKKITFIVFIKKTINVIDIITKYDMLKFQNFI